MTETLLPGLLIGLPILAAAVTLAAGRIRSCSGWYVAFSVLLIETALATWLVATIYGNGARVVHFLGGETFGRRGAETFAVGIELVADPLSGAIAGLVAIVSLAVLAYTRHGGPRGGAFYTGYLLLTGGLMGVTLTGDLFNLFVFLEITGIASYALVASDRSAESAVAALKYLIIGTVGASLYLAGVGFIYVQTGTLNMVDVSRSLAGDPAWIDGALYGDPVTIAGFAFMAVGLLTKAAIFPLHTWQPDAYAGAPDSVTVYIAALVSTVSAYAFGRVVLSVYTPAFFEATPIGIEAVMLLAGVSVLAGSVLAVAQSRVKRMFAYSSVAQFGLIVIAFGLAVHPASGPTATKYAVLGAVIHLVAHAIIKGGLFSAAGALGAATGARTVASYAGMARRKPYLSGAIVLLGLGIIGIPPTVGFIGKWYIALGAVHSGLWSIVFIVFASTLLTLLYVARIVERLYFAPPIGAGSGVVADGGSVPTELRFGSGLSLGMFGLTVVAALLTLVLGFLGAEMTAALDPLVEAVEAHSPTVGVDAGDVAVGGDRQ